MLLSANADITRIEELSVLGYDAIDVSLCRVIYNNDPYPHNPLLDGENYEKTLDGYMKQCKALELAIVSTHIPYRFDYAAPTIPNYDYYHKMTVRAFQASEYLGADWAVMHIRRPEDTVEYVKRLFYESGNAHTGIAIENDMEHPIEELIEACDTLKAQGYRVGICLDVGHCHANRHDYNVADIIRLLGTRIKVLHIHDNCGNIDMHKAPYTGTIDWQTVMHALSDIDYAGTFNFELMPERIPEPCRDAYERYCVSTGRYLIGLFDQFKNGGKV